MPPLIVPASNAVAPATAYLPAPWLRDADTLCARVAREALQTVLTWEQPLGSNRGPEIDAWLRWAEVPEAVITSGKGYWCAAWATKMWSWAGAEVIRTAGCDEILRWGQRTGRFTEHVPSVGAFVLYGRWNAAHLAQGRRVLLSKMDAVHVGIVARCEDGQVGTVEGNTTVEGSRLERNGTAVAVKLVTEADPVIGFVHVRSQGR